MYAGQQARLYCRQIPLLWLAHLTGTHRTHVPESLCQHAEGSHPHGFHRGNSVARYEKLLVRARGQLQQACGSSILLSEHGGPDYAAKGSASRPAIPCLSTTLIPLFMSGEELDATNRSVP